MFWDNFIRLCNAAGKSPSSVAVEIGLTDAAPTGWKKGAVPRSSTLHRIADYFHVSVSDLISTEKTEKPAAQGDGLSFAQRALIDYVRGLSDQEAAALLVTLKTLKGAPQAPDQSG